MKFHEWQERHGEKLDEELESLAAEVVDAALTVHRELGPGLPEKSYALALSYELELRNVPHVCEAPVKVLYKGRPVGEGKVDILVAGRLVVELKAVDQLSEVHRSQVLTYLSILHLQLGLLINFNVALLKDGIKRVIKSR